MNIHILIVFENIGVKLNSSLVRPVWVVRSFGLLHLLAWAEVPDLRLAAAFHDFGLVLGLDVEGSRQVHSLHRIHAILRLLALTFVPLLIVRVGTLRAREHSLFYLIFVQGQVIIVSVEYLAKHILFAAVSFD